MLLKVWFHIAEEPVTSEMLSIFSAAEADAPVFHFQPILSVEIESSAVNDTVFVQPLLEDVTVPALRTISAPLRSLSSLSTLRNVTAFLSVILNGTPSQRSITVLITELSYSIT